MGRLTQCKEERCSNCAYCLKISDGFVCDNSDSDMYGYYVEYDISCEVWEKR